MRVNDRQHCVANAFGALRIDAETRRREHGVGNRFQIILRDRRRSQIPKGFLRVATVNQFGDKLGVDRIGRNLRKLIDQLAEYAGKGGEKPIILET